MFDVGFSEIILIAIALLVAVGPEDLPDLLFRFGRLVRRVRMMTGSLRDQYAEIIHDAEMAHYRKEFGTKLVDDARIDESRITGTDDSASAKETAVSEKDAKGSDDAP